MRRITHRDIANAAGVTQATVSLALGGKPGVGEAMRRRIQEISERLGYVPDPAFARIAEYRHGDGHRARAQTIAFLSGWNERNPDQSETHYPPKLDAARIRAKALGWKIEHHFLSADIAQQKRLSRILRARGIRGLIIAGTRQTPRPPQLDWAHFCTVVLGHANAPEGLHSCGVDYFQGVSLAIRHLKAAGAKRIGLAIGRASAEWAKYDPVGGFVQVLLAEHEEVSEPLIVEKPSKDVVIRWVRRHQIDTVLAGTGTDAVLIKELLSSHPVRIAALNVGTAQCAGVREPSDEIGATGVDLLHIALARDERGFPAQPRKVLIGCQWCGYPPPAATP